ncbi:hypothetical protein BJ138DRAFT_1112155 [Hygrophoropsis aurantiaca]|uniref:Uncharacterized protein n=1 Tax=Hygrophoropsis aurantiaca TaxID=72124 RepID=A0ACB8AIE8_9AGAM|nr:hypothetical protein BJ138DRAFT_1112155 [Hygrophoropsis aurantiaca]
MRSARKRLRGYEAPQKPEPVTLSWTSDEERPTSANASAPAPSSAPASAPAPAPAPAPADVDSDDEEGTQWSNARHTLQDP